MLFAGNQFLVHIFQFLRYHHETLKRQRFRVAHVAEQVPGGLQEPFFGQNNLIFMLSIVYGTAWNCFLSYEYFTLTLMKERHL